MRFYRQSLMKTVKRKKGKGHSTKREKKRERASESIKNWLRSER